MATIDDVKTAYKAVYRVDPPAAVASAVAAQIDSNNTTLDAYIASLVTGSVTTTGAAIAVASFIDGKAPSSARVDSLVPFADAQQKSYAAQGANTTLAAFEAIGLGYVRTESTKAAFATKYGSGTDADFINTNYFLAIGAAPSAGAFQNLQSQLNYFKTIYATPGKSAADVALEARGAVLGQIIGYAVTDPTAKATAAIDDQVASFLTAAAKGTATYDAPLPVGSGSQGTVTLTVNPDTKSANIFNAPQLVEFGQVNPTLNSADVLTGTGTNPTLNIGGLATGLGASTNPTLNGIKVINVDNVAGGGAAALNLSKATGVQTITVNNSGTVAVQNIKLDPAAKLAVSNSLGTTTFNFDGNSLGGATDAVAVDLTRGFVTLTSTLVGAAIETVNVKSNGDVANGSTLVGGQLAGASTLNVEGAGILTALGGANSLADSIKTVDASKSTGGVLIGTSASSNLAKLTGGDGKDTVVLNTVSNVEVSLGKGDDTLGFGATLSAGDKADGGEGRNTVSVTATTPANAADVKNFQVVSLGLNVVDTQGNVIVNNGFQNGAIVDVSKFAGSTIDTVVVKNGLINNSSATIQKLASGSTVAINGLDGKTADLGADNFNAITVEVTDATKVANTTDVLNVTIGRVATTAVNGTAEVNVQTLNVAGIETLNVKASGGGSNTVIGDIGLDAALTKLIVTGEDNLTVGGQIGDIKLTTIDASAATGKFIMTNASGAGTGDGNAGVTISGSALGGVLLGNLNNDVIKAGAGNTDIIAGAGADNITGGAGNDRIAGGTGIDSIDISSGGTDKIDIRGIIATENRDVVTGFAAGASGDQLLVQDSELTFTGAITFQNSNTTGVAVNWTTNTKNVLEIDVDFTGKNISDGAGLLAANGGAINGEAAGAEGYIVAYADGKAFVYYGNSGANATFEAGEIQLVGVLNGVSTGGIAAANFTKDASFTLLG